MLYVAMYVYIFIGTYCGELHKMVYLDNRRYLPNDSTLRKEKHTFPSKNEETLPPPPKRSFRLMHDHQHAFQNSYTQ